MRTRPAVSVLHHVGTPDLDGPGTALNRTYRELANHYGFKVDATPPRAPKKKGKVESAVKYVKRNFFKGRDGSDAAGVAKELTRWVTEIADKSWRPHES